MVLTINSINRLGFVSCEVRTELLYIISKKFKGLTYDTRTAMVEDGGQAVVSRHVVAVTEVAGCF
jgi:hypothetical protein